MSAGSTSKPTNPPFVVSSTPGKPPMANPSSSTNSATLQPSPIGPSSFQAPPRYFRDKDGNLKYGVPQGTDRIVGGGGYGGGYGGYNNMTNWQNSFAVPPPMPPNSPAGTSMPPVPPSPITTMPPLTPPYSSAIINPLLTTMPPSTTTPTPTGTPAGTLTPTDTPTGTPTSRPLMIPPQHLREPNGMIFIHEYTWMKYGRLVCVAPDPSGYGVLVLTDYTGEANVFRVRADNTISPFTSATKFITSSTSCSSIELKDAKTDESRWSFGYDPVKQRYKILSNCDTKMAIGCNTIGGNTVCSLDAPPEQSFWFILRVGALTN